MEIPKAEHSIWSDLITGKKAFVFECLAIKIFLGTATVRARHDPSLVPLLARDLREIVVKSQSLPSAQNDIQKILKGI